MSRNYQTALQCLNSQQSNAAVLDAVRTSGGAVNKISLPEVEEYLCRIGHTASLYTSPHIVAVRERIRINGVPLSEDEFTKYFFEVWDLLERNPTRSLPTTPIRPNYFRLLTIVAFHAFLSLNVDVTVLEVGIGGRFDSTNIVPQPLVTGVTSLGLDHVSVLGNTLGEIARNKGGVPAFSVEQPEEGMIALQDCATTQESSVFTVVPVIPELLNINLGIAGDHQRQNASLAIRMTHQVLKALVGKDYSLEPLDRIFVEGVQQARWPGRCQKVVDPKASNTTWFLDGSHTIESITCGMEWFGGLMRESKSEDSSLPVKRVLIFNCTSGRSGSKFLETILQVISARLKARGITISPELIFSRVIFCTNVTYMDGGFKPDLASAAITKAGLSNLNVQEDLARNWQALLPAFPISDIHVLPSIQNAVEVIRSLEEPDTDIQVLVCGSLHLVGGVIEVAGLSDVALRS
ncbi:hypothetical protein Clacol_001692 [Clathrus columnatus]|uniref:tetrahydrofolate synthase n=1 Tax=Clathrus columnatus TaxID=1419009 RepID=A0AAV5A3B1_9AGAM|nr:hypothetical protein Clacol_001692 [Clathrus columnatus]